jgi:hypothetical protein
MFKPRTDYDRGYVAGLEAAAEFIAAFNSTSGHAYRLDDCIRSKFNITSRARPRRNQPPRPQTRP